MSTETEEGVGEQKTQLKALRMGKAWILLFREHGKFDNRPFLDPRNSVQPKPEIKFKKKRKIAFAACADSPIPAQLKCKRKYEKFHSDITLHLYSDKTSKDELIHERSPWTPVSRSIIPWSNYTYAVYTLLWLVTHFTFVLLNCVERWSKYFQMEILCKMMTQELHNEILNLEIGYKFIT